MLIYFSVENFRSIKEKIELDMQPAPKMRRFKHHVVDLKHKNKLKALRSAVIYGANASGKSNIVKAIDFAHTMITNGNPQKSGVLTQHFELAAQINPISSFCFEFVTKGRFYVYSFSISAKRVESESLYLIDGSEELCVFKREFDEKDNQIKFSTDYANDKNLEQSHTKELETLIRFTNDNQLFLHEVIEGDYFKKFDDRIGINLFWPMLFFGAQLVVIFPNSHYNGIVPDFNDKSHIKYESALRAFDTGIKSISAQEVPLAEFDQKFLDLVKSKLNSQGDKDFPYITLPHNEKVYTFTQNEQQNILAYSTLATHEVFGGGTKVFDIEEESDGTKRLLDLLPAICTKDNGNEDDQINRTYIIDEFDRSLHPNLSKAFLAKFLNCDLCLVKDQLIVTTHEDALLDNELLRRDEIWFVQKEYDSSTNLYSLNDYSPRFDKDIQKDYLSGKFGAIPIIMESYIKECN